MSGVPDICLCAATFNEGRGGIARVARLMAKVVAEEVAAGRVTAQAVEYLRPITQNLFGIPVKNAGGSKLGFSAMIAAAQLRATHFIYDQGGLMRAHNLMPFRRRPALCYIHGIEVWENATPADLRPFGKADVLLSNSEYTKNRAHHVHGCLGNVEVCWLGTEEDIVPEECGGEASEDVLIVGRLVEDRDKGHAALFGCWEEVLKACPEARLVVVGTGTGEGYYRALAAGSPVSNSIVFKGHVVDRDLARLYSECACVAMPSRGEGFGLVYVEAMRYGKPVIASVHDAAGEIVVDGKTGYCVDLSADGMLADRIVRLLTGRKIARELGRAGFERWSKYFAYSRFKERFQEHVLSLLTIC